jgi:hypothetical protein
METYEYVGSELDLFEKATRWKAYLRKQIARYLGSTVLEVGAGYGGTTRVLCHGDAKLWLCLEPDSTLADRLNESIRAGELPRCCQATVGTLSDLTANHMFETCMYIDVIEHIEDDRSELERAANRLLPGGHLIVLAPAHQWLYTPFDRAIGHFRRYTCQSLREISPPGLELVRLGYLDAVGLLASLGNRCLLRSSMPNERQIFVWDKMMVPLSRFIDPIFGYRIGKSVLGIWRRPLESMSKATVPETQDVHGCLS